MTLINSTLIAKARVFTVNVAGIEFRLGRMCSFQLAQVDGGEKILGLIRGSRAGKEANLTPQEETDLRKNVLEVAMEQPAFDEIPWVELAPIADVLFSQWMGSGLRVDPTRESLKEKEGTS